MKIFALPAHLPGPDYDWSAPVSDWQKKEDAHRAELKKYLVALGYSHKATGGTYRTPIADGYAEYMYFEAPRGGKCGLVHLPYGDAYQCPNVQHLPKRVIVERIAAEKRIAALFAKKAG
jgi:hypothetical protein